MITGMTGPRYLSENFIQFPMVPVLRSSLSLQFLSCRVCVLQEMQKAAEEIIRSHWRSFFNSTIPALHNQTPNEAAKSANGQRLLSELLNFYDQCNSKSSGMELKASDGVSSNPPSAWVKWR